MPNISGPGGLVDKKYSCRFGDDFPKLKVHLSYERTSLEIEYDSGAFHHLEFFGFEDCHDFALMMGLAVEAEDWGEHRGKTISFRIDAEDDGSFALRLWGLDDPGMRLLFVDLEGLITFANHLEALVTS